MYNPIISLKMKQLIFAVALLCWFFPLKAQTDVSGIISANTTWTETASPYHVVGNILVDLGVTLTIEPGVEVVVDSAKYIYVDGALHAEATAIDSIKFYCDSGITWQGISFRAASAANSHILKYCSIRDAETAISIDGASPIVDYCTIHYNEVGVDVTGYTADPIVTHNLIAHNSVYGITGNSHDGYVIEGNTIVHNAIGIYFEAFSYHTKISYNIIGFNDYGLYVDHAGIIYETNHNIFVGNRMVGAFIEEIIPLQYPLKYNSFVYNATGVSNLSGDLHMEYSTLVMNELGLVYIDYNTAQDNFIHFCNIFGNSEYGVHQQSPWDTDVTYDWWGSTTPSIIDTCINDLYDDLNQGRVLYSPFLTEPNTDAPVAPPLNFTKTDLGGGFVQLSWAISPEADIAGYKVYWGPTSCCSYAHSLDVGNILGYTLTGVDSTDTIVVTAYDDDADGLNDIIEGHESWYAYDQLSLPMGIAYGDQSVPNHLSLFPNPVSEFAIIESEKPLEEVSLCIYNMMGALISRRAPQSGNQITVSVKDLPNGLYYVVLSAHDMKPYTLKMIVAK